MLARGEHDARERHHALFLDRPRMTAKACVPTSPSGRCSRAYFVELCDLLARHELIDIDGAALSMATAAISSSVTWCIALETS